MKVDSMIIIMIILIIQSNCKFNNTLIINNEKYLNNDNNNTKENKCSSTFPESKSDCTDIIIDTKRGDYSCCLFIMSKPNITKTCVPILSVFLPIKNEASKINLPGNSIIEGFVDCKTFFQMIKVEVILFIIILIFV